jgi:hypothetical protein
MSACEEGSRVTPVVKTSVGETITRMVKRCSCSKYGPAIQDHERVLDQLLQFHQQQQQQTLSSCLFAAPNMLAIEGGIKEDYYGGPGSVEAGIANSRVWHGVSIHDAATMLLSHLVAVSTLIDDHANEEEENKPKPPAQLPPLVCLSYQ